MAAAVKENVRNQVDALWEASPVREADTLPAIIQELLLAKTSERRGRVIDYDSSGSMEKKNKRGTSERSGSRR